FSYVVGHPQRRSAVSDGGKSAVQIFSGFRARLQEKGYGIFYLSRMISAKSCNMRMRVDQPRKQRFSSAVDDFFAVCPFGCFSVLINRLNLSLYNGYGAFLTALSVRERREKSAVFQNHYFTSSISKIASISTGASIGS